MKLFFNVMFLCLVLFTYIGCDPDDDGQEPGEEEVIESRVYNAYLIEREINHLDSQNDQDKAEERRAELKEGLAKLFESQADLIYVGIRPPLPCPGNNGGSDPNCFPGDPNIGNLLIGVFTNFPKEAMAKFTDFNSEELVASGELVNYDEEYSTAWFKFDVVNSELVQNELQLNVTTKVDAGASEFKIVEMSDHFDAQTFSHKK